MPDSSPKTMTYVASFLLVLLIVGGLFEARKRSRFRKTEAQLVAQIKQATDAPELRQGADEYPQERWDPALHAQLGRIAARLQEAIQDCVVKHWSDYPVEARVRLSTDPAGRLVTVAIEGANDNAENCLATVLARGQYPRKIDGVAQLILSYR
jgi:hypothetical protein